MVYFLIWFISPKSKMVGLFQRMFYIHIYLPMLAKKILGNSLVFTIYQKWLVYFMEIPMKIDDLGVPLVQETSISEYPYFVIAMTYSWIAFQYQLQELKKQTIEIRIMIWPNHRGTPRFAPCRSFLRQGQNRLLQTEPAEVSQLWNKCGVMVIMRWLIMKIKHGQRMVTWWDSGWFSWSHIHHNYHNGEFWKIQLPQHVTCVHDVCISSKVCIYLGIFCKFEFAEFGFLLLILHVWVADVAECILWGNCWISHQIAGYHYLASKQPVTSHQLRALPTPTEFRIIVNHRIPCARHQFSAGDEVIVSLGNPLDKKAWKGRTWDMGAPKRGYFGTSICGYYLSIYPSIYAIYIYICICIYLCIYIYTYLYIYI